MRTDVDSRVLGAPPASPEVAAAFFSTRLRCETDPFDVHADLTARVGGLVLLDARRREAYDAGHLPGARCLPHQDLTPEAVAVLDPDAVYVTYGWGPACNAGTRAAARLAAAGLRVKEMIGGVEYWVRQGYPTEREI